MNELLDFLKTNALINTTLELMYTSVTGDTDKSPTDKSSDGQNPHI